MDGEVEKFLALVGQTLPFYGVDTCHFKLGNTVWHAIEDESDGYRSYLGSIAEIAQNNLIFRDTPIATVQVAQYDDYGKNGFRLIDIDDGHCWLRVGTDNTDDYYPMFVFEYEPKT